jgi:hypothetical protein
MCGQAVAGLSAYTKSVSPGIVEPRPELEQARRGRRERVRVRVAERWPGEPKPAAGPDELLVLARRFGECPAGQAAGA